MKPPRICHLLDKRLTAVNSTALYELVLSCENVRNVVVERSKFIRVGGLKAKQSHRLVGDGVDDRVAAQHSDWHIVGRLNGGVFSPKEVFLGSVVVRCPDTEIPPQLLFVAHADFLRIWAAHVVVDLRPA